MPKQTQTPMQNFWVPRGLYSQVLCELVKPPELAKKVNEAKETTPRRMTKSKKNEAAQLEEMEQKFLDHLLATPTALLQRKPIERTVYVTVRPGASFPFGFVVDDVFHSPGQDRVKLSQVIDNLGEPELRCGTFWVEVLPIFRNLDVLVRAGQFMAAAIRILGIPVPTSDPKNLDPLYTFMHWWRHSTKPRVADCDWDGIENWIRQEFENREYLLAGGSDSVKIELPACYRDLARELLFDSELTSSVLNSVRAQRTRIDPNLTDRDVVELELVNCANTAFRNSERWAQESLAKNPEEPKWFGFAYLQASKLAERKLLRQSDGPKAPQLPIKHGREMLGKLSPPEGVSTIEAAVGMYLASGATAENKIFEKYFPAKSKFAKANYYLTVQALNKFIGNSPSQEQRQAAVMGLLRAIDQWVWDSWKNERQRKRREYEFVRLSCAVIGAHLSKDGGRPTHPFDQQILDKLMLDRSSAPPEYHPVPPAKTMATAKDHTESIARRELLERMCNHAGLSPVERHVVFVEAGYESLDPKDSEKEQKKLLKSVTKKLKKVASHFKGSVD